MTGNSASLAKIGEKLFTITFVEDSNYTQGEVITQGVKITTKEMFDVDGNQMNKFHTTHAAIVNRFKRMFGEYAMAHKRKYMIKELELKVELYNLFASV